MSYWQASASDSPLHDHGRHDALPEGEVDIAIIGSGISGTVAAYVLQKQAPHTKIVMLEARQACSGATGRNGGHCRPDSFLGFERYSKIVGKEQAHKVLLNEWDTFNLMKTIIAEEGIECNWWEGLTMTIYLHDEVMRAGKENFDSYSQYTAIRPDVAFIDDADQTRKLSRIPDSVGAAIFPAGSLFPLRFVHGLLSRCISRGSFQLLTHTAVTKLTKDSHRWTLQTEKGRLSARKVLLATNGYSQALLPSIDIFLLSHRAHCSSILPPEEYQADNALKSTCSIVGAKGDYEYLVQRPSAPAADNAFVLGGGHTIINKQQELDIYDDSFVDSSMPPYFASYPEKTFDGWNTSQAKLTHVWTGIQGYTRDSLPLVGESFEDEGLFLCLGHHGHGMARAASCARGVAQLMLSDCKEHSNSDWETITKLPSCYRWTKKRATRTDVDCRWEF